MTPSQLLPADDLLDQMAENLKEYIASHNIENPAMVGIHSGGAWLAEVLHKKLNIESPLGLININFYRDDFTQRGLQPQVNGSDLPFDIDNRHLILIDDVIKSGRTIRAALNELFDYGRPNSVTLAAMIDINQRELPIQADIIGQTISLNDGQQIKLSGPTPLQLTISQRTQ
jgi:pyrimidine operon attenuation protein/uracil phosphoribosyltransferase